MTSFYHLKKNLGNLHILRGLCAFYVVIYHAKFFFWSGGQGYINKFPSENWSWFNKLVFAIDMSSSAGKEMVYIFFILSGFFISLSVSNTNYSYFQFIKVRFTRIYVPFIFAIFLGGALFWLSDLIISFDSFKGSSLTLNYELFEHKEHIGIISFLKVLFVSREGTSFFGYNYVYWSLAYELLFYLVIGFFMSQLKRIYLSVGFILVYFLGYLFDLPSIGRVDFNYFIFFGVGILLQILFARNEQKLIKTKINKWIVLPLILVSFLAILFFLKVKDVPVFVELFTVVLSVLSIYALLLYEIKILWLKRILVYLGEVSYSLYLSHIPFFILFYSIGFYFTNEITFYSRGPYWVMSFLVVPFTLIVYYGAEKPSLKLIRQIKKGNRA